MNMSNVMEKFSMAGRAAVVTGGAGLLGRQFSRTLAQAGAKVLVADLSGDAAQAQADSILDEGLLAAACSMNVTDPQSTKAMVKKAINLFGRLDVLVNSAARDPKFDPQNQSK